MATTIPIISETSCPIPNPSISISRLDHQYLTRFLIDALLTYPYFFHLLHLEFISIPMAKFNNSMYTVRKRKALQVLPCFCDRPQLIYKKTQLIYNGPQLVYKAANSSQLLFSWFIWFLKIITLCDCPQPNILTLVRSEVWFQPPKINAYGVWKMWNERLSKAFKILCVSITRCSVTWNWKKGIWPLL